MSPGFSCIFRFFVHVCVPRSHITENTKVPTHGLQNWNTQQPPCAGAVVKYKQLESPAQRGHVSYDNKLLFLITLSLRLHPWDTHSVQRDVPSAMLVLRNCHRLAGSIIPNYRWECLAARHCCVTQAI